MLRVPIIEKDTPSHPKKINAMIKRIFKLIIKLNMYVKCVAIFNNCYGKIKQKRKME